MERIQWNQSYSVGNGLMDSQHKVIFELINRLVAKFESDQQIDAGELSELLTRMTSYAEEHFAAEEQLMDACGYPDAEAHKAEHRQYIVRVVELSQDAMTHKQSVSDDLTQFLFSWWREHILNRDMEYKQYLAQMGQEQ